MVWEQCGLVPSVFRVDEGCKNSWMVLAQLWKKILLISSNVPYDQHKEIYFLSGRCDSDVYTECLQVGLITSQ